MSIHWFPGHMHKTQKALLQRVPNIDVVIELLDARLPGSSANPLLAQLTADKPTLKVLNKQDLADAELTSQWLAHYQAQPGTQALALDASETAPARRLLAACRALAPQRDGMVKPLRLLICGIPNVGKSTLINTLHGQRIAATGDEPGITTKEQQIQLASDVYLFDTPGMLWPRISVEQSGYHLAASGGIGRNAYDDVDVALALLAQVRLRYAARLCDRYRQDNITALDDEALLGAIARQRGDIGTGGAPSLLKAAERVLKDFRAGAWGRITLETVAEFLAWSAAAQALELQRQATAQERVAARRSKR